MNEEACFVQRSMSRPRVIDAQHRPIIESYGETARIGDGTVAVEGKPAGHSNEDAEGAKKLVAYRHCASPPALETQFVTVTIIFIRGWIAQITLTSPTVVNITSV